MECRLPSPPRQLPWEGVRPVVRSFLWVCESAPNFSSASTAWTLPFGVAAHEPLSEKTRGLMFKAGGASTHETVLECPRVI